jgi:hypothetical protein
MTEYSDGFARQLEDILEDVSAGRLTVQEAAEQIRRQSPQSLHRAPRKRPRSIGVVIATVGVIFFAMATLIGVQSYQFTARAVKSNATVIELVQSDRVQKPRYKYIVNGVEFTGLSTIGSNPPSYTVGDTVEIEYLPDDPARSRIASWAERWTGTLVLTVMGGIVTVIGAVIIILTRR